MNGLGIDILWVIINKQSFFEHSNDTLIHLRNRLLSGVIVASYFQARDAVFITKLVQFLLDFRIQNILNVFTEIWAKLRRLVFAFYVIDQFIVEFAAKFDIIKVRSLFFYFHFLINKNVLLICESEPLDHISSDIICLM